MLLALLACTPRYDFQHGAFDSTRTLQHDGLERRYALYTSSAEGPLPLVVVLHGGGATLKAFLAENGRGASPLASVWLNLADAQGFHVVIPEGLDTHWNGCRTDCKTGCREDVDDVAFLTALVESVSGEVSVERVHVTGESNGGLMTQRMAREASTLVASVGVVNAAMAANNECNDPSRAVPIAYVVGSADEAMPWDGGDSGAGEMASAEDTVALWLGANGCTGEVAVESLPDLDPDDGSTVERQQWACTGADVVRYVALGGGHVPPSIDQQTSDGWDALAGEQNHDIETAHEIWAFFEANP